MSEKPNNQNKTNQYNNQGVNKCLFMMQQM